MSVWLSKILPKTLVEWLVVIVIVAFLAGLLIPPVVWVADGTIEVPVRVVVFDAATARPITNAAVGIVRAPSAEGVIGLEERREVVAMALPAIDLEEFAVRADENGSATIDVTFNTVCSNRNPERRAHTGSFWVIVSADGYGRVVVPLRYQSTPTASLQDQGELPVYVGIAGEKQDAE